MIHKEIPDHYWKTQRGIEAYTVTPRVLLVEPGGVVPMIPLFGWFGLYGGHMNIQEAKNAGSDANRPNNFIPTLIRETWEESGVDIQPFIRHHAPLLGVSKVRILNPKTHTIITAFSPILVCRIPGGLPFGPDVAKVPAGHIPKHTFPDAALALIQWDRMQTIRNPEQHIQPEWLNTWGDVLFTLTPRPRYLRGEPPLRTLGYWHDTPPIPKHYSPEIRTWLRNQYRKL